MPFLSSKTYVLKLKSKKKGFTLIELLVVVGIIALIATLILASFDSSRRKARDAQRQSDITQIQLAVEQYYDDYQVMPTCNGAASCASTTGCSYSINWPTFGTAISAYLKTLPSDPNNTGCGNGTNSFGYFYMTGYKLASGGSTILKTNILTDYVLATHLEAPGLTNIPIASSPFLGVTGINFAVGTQY